MHRLEFSSSEFFSISLIVAFIIIGIESCNTPSSKDIENSHSSFFSENARICFVGNSITHGGQFHHDILLYHVTRFPEEKKYFYNCGVAGDVTSGVLDRMEDDILINKPTHAVMMLGMNDVERQWYGPNPTTDADTLKYRENALNLYKKNYEIIIKYFLSKNIKVILERPTIYDETAVIPMKNNLGVNNALNICATYGDTLATKYNLPTVNYFTIMSKINKKMQLKDSSFSITGTDRIHPNHTGNLVMSYQFLKTDEAPKYVSKIIVDNNIRKSSPDSYNCKIESVLKLKTGIKFSVKENALPFPTIKEQKTGLQLVPFTDELNVELLKVTNLPKGVYQLKIDEILIDNFSEDQLNKGINLAEYNKTPQYQQAQEVLNVLNELWELESHLRGMKFIEYLPFYKGIKNKDDFKEVEIYMDSTFIAHNYTDPYYYSQLKKFITHKPNEEEYKRESDLLRDKAYKIAQPVAHTFELIAK